MNIRCLDCSHDGRYLDRGAGLDLANRHACDNPGHHLDGLDDRNSGDGSLDHVNQTSLLL